MIIAKDAVGALGAAKTLIHGLADPASGPVTGQRSEEVFQALQKSLEEAAALMGSAQLAPGWRPQSLTADGLAAKMRGYARDVADARRLTRGMEDSREYDFGHLATQSPLRKDVDAMHAILAVEAPRASASPASRIAAVYDLAGSDIGDPGLAQRYLAAARTR